MIARRWLVRAVTGALILYWLALFVGTHVPLSVGNVGGHGDKLVHWVSYAGLAFLCGLAVSLHRPLSWRAWLLLAAALAAYAAVDELLQIPVPGRYGDPWDWVADLVGILPGLAAACAVRPLLAKNPGPGEGRGNDTPDEEASSSRSPDGP